MSRNHITTPIRLWRPEAFNRHSQQDFLTYGALYGILLGMCLFNLFVFLSLRDQVYLRYVFYMFSMLMYLLNRNGHYIALFDMGPGGSRIWHWAFLGGLIFFASTFTKSFLSTPTALPRLNKLISLSQVLGVVVIVSGLANLEVVAHPVSLAAGLLGPGCGLAAGVIRASRGYKPARYFLLAWSALLIGVMQYVLHSLGVSPLDVSGSLMMSLGAAAESVLLSFALADRIHLLRKEKEALALSRMRYRTASLTDGLTGLFNLRYLQDHLVREADQAKVDDSPLCLIMMDVDDFKRFNDAHGHQMGDRVLIRLADVLRSCARTKDAACRYGGEEFVLVLPETDLDQACLVAERIRGEFAGQTFLMDNGDKLAATISLGVAQLQEKESPANLLKRADHALYQAKTHGKNRVEKNRW
jgi:diguanylate cyclase (GGDEF)-like protein